MLEAPLKIEISASTVAWYGAIVATAGFIISAANYFRDRSKIKVGFKRNYKTTQDALGYSTAKKYSMVTVVNMGRRPIYIKMAAFKTYGPGSLILSDSFAEHRKKTLNEENPETMFLIDESTYDLKQISHVAVYDGRGKEYRKYLTQTPTIRKMGFMIRELLKKMFSKP